jgi:hypothetical protein
VLTRLAPEDILGFDARDYFEVAKQRADKVHLNTRYIGTDEAKLEGFILEEGILNLLPVERPKGSVPYNHDVLFRSRLLEVKAERTPSWMIEIPLDWDARCQDYYHQKCDFYIHGRINLKKKLGWIIGFISRDEYFALAGEPHKAGTDYNGIKLKEDTWMVPYSKLYPLRLLGVVA